MNIYIYVQNRVPFPPKLFRTLSVLNFIPLVDLIIISSKADGFSIGPKHFNTIEHFSDISDSDLSNCAIESSCLPN